jgi:hypothetical protein
MKKALFTIFIFTLAFVGVLSSRANAACYSNGYCDNSYYSNYNTYNNGWYGNNSNTWGASYPTVWGTTYPVTWGTTYPTTWGGNYNTYGCTYTCYSYSQPYNYNSGYPYNNYYNNNNIEPEFEKNSA